MQLIRKKRCGKGASRYPDDILQCMANSQGPQLRDKSKKTLETRPRLPEPALFGSEVGPHCPIFWREHKSLFLVSSNGEGSLEVIG